MELTVDDITRTPPMEGCKIIAGLTGQNRMIKQLSMLDGFVGHHYLKENTLAVSSGYFLSLELERTIAFLKELAQLEISGLTLKEKYFEKQELQKICQIADTLAFPIILLKESMRFYELFDFFYSHIHCYRMNAYLPREEVTSVLVSAIYRKGLEGFVHQLYKWTGKTVLVIFRQNVYTYPKTEFPGAMLKELACYNAGTKMIQTDLKDILCFQSGEALGLGIIFHYKKELEAMIWLEQPKMPFNANDIALLQAAKTACETGVMQIISFEQDDLQLKERFVAGLLDGTLTTMKQTVSMAQRLSWFIPERLRVALVENVCQPDRCQAVQSLLEKNFTVLGERFIVSIYQQYLVLLLPQQMPDYMERMRSIHDLLTEYPLPGSFRIAVGGEADIGQTRLSYKQAELCLRAAAILKQERPVLSYDTMGIFALWGGGRPQSGASGNVQQICAAT